MSDALGPKGILRETSYFMRYEVHLVMMFATGLTLAKRMQFFFFFLRLTINNLLTIRVFATWLTLARSISTTLFSLKRPWFKCRVGYSEYLD